MIKTERLKNKKIDPSIKSSWYFHAYLNAEGQRMESYFFTKEITINISKYLHRLIDEIYRNPEHINIVSEEFNISFIYSSEDLKRNILKIFYSQEDRRVYIILTEKGTELIKKGAEKRKLLNELIYNFEKEHIYEQQRNANLDPNYYENQNNHNFYDRAIEKISGDYNIQNLANFVSRNFCRSRKTIQEVLCKIPKETVSDFSYNSLRDFVARVDEALKDFKFHPSVPVVLAMYSLAEEDTRRTFLEKLFKIEEDNLPLLVRKHRNIELPKTRDTEQLIDFLSDKTNITKELLNEQNDAK